MSSEYDRWSVLRRPLPEWWPTEIVRDRDIPVSAGIVFIIRRENGEARRVRILRTTLEGISARRIDDGEAEVVWNRHQDQFASIAKKLIAENRSSAETIDITLADLIAGNYDLWPE